MFGPTTNERLNPFGQATAQATTGFTFAVVAWPARTDSSVVQCLPRGHVVRDSKNKESVIHQHNLQRETGQFTAACQTTRRRKSAADFTFDFRPERLGCNIPPTFHFPGNGAHMRRRTRRQSVAPHQIVCRGFGHTFQANLRQRNTGCPLDHKIGHHFRVTTLGVI